MWWNVSRCARPIRSALAAAPPGRNRAGARARNAAAADLAALANRDAAIEQLSREIRAEALCGSP